MSDKSSPAKSANNLNKILNVFYDAHGGDRFPVDIDALALSAHEIFKWSDPIKEIKECNVNNFEGMLASNSDQTEWMILYNSSLKSQGRIRFTKAHELGHYILHRKIKNSFEYNRQDMLNWLTGNDIESEANIFASYLLMPLDDFRLQVNADVTIDMFMHCASRYGVSLTATLLKWLSYTDKKAVLILSNDGFMQWSSSSKSAFNSGAYFKTRDNIIAIPESSLAANNKIDSSSEGQLLNAKVWFPLSGCNDDITEMKLYSEHYNSTLSLLILSKHSEFWPSENK